MKTDQVRQHIGQTQDGNLKPRAQSDFDDFINNRLRFNETADQTYGVDELENLQSDFRYMIHELKKAEASLDQIKFGSLKK